MLVRVLVNFKFSIISDKSLAFYNHQDDLRNMFVNVWNSLSFVSVHGFVVCQPELLLTQVSLFQDHFVCNLAVVLHVSFKQQPMSPLHLHCLLALSLCSLVIVLDYFDQRIFGLGVQPVYCLQKYSETVIILFGICA